jgi:tRNA modification GTPase
MNAHHTIIAQCTPQGSGALALLRLSGKNALFIADQLSDMPSDKALSLQKTHTIHYGWVIDADRNRLDQVLFLIMHAPRTFTGEDTVEITCHNNPFIIASIINAAVTAGARVAHAGEFSQQAVLNNKITVTQAEAINELIHANTQQALKQSLAQLQGSLSNWIHTIEQKLITALAFSEASFEFIDEESMEFASEICHIITEVLQDILQLKKTFNQQQHIRQGIRIAIIGSVNAGKSSFFNALLGKDRAIVTHIAGTTRDVIEAGLYKNGNYWTLIDTAGLRTTDDVIEQIGITRSYEEAHKADVILLVFDGSQPLITHEIQVYQELISLFQSKIIIIQNKSDIKEHATQFTTEPTITISAKTRHNIEYVETVIQEKIETLFCSIDSPFLLNQRHYNSLMSLEQNLHVIIPMLNGSRSYELISYHLQESLVALSELSGKSISEAGMDAIFRQFCVGK